MELCRNSGPEESGKERGGTDADCDGNDITGAVRERPFWGRYGDRRSDKNFIFDPVVHWGVGNDGRNLDEYQNQQKGGRNMKLAAKKLAAVMLMAAMVGTIPGVDVFAESVQGTSSVPDSYNSCHSPDSSDGTATEGSSESLVTDGTDSADSTVSTGNTGAAPDSTESASSSPLGNKKKAYDVTASGFVGDKYEMTANDIKQKSKELSAELARIETEAAEKKAAVNTTT